MRFTITAQLLRPNLTSNQSYLAGSSKQQRHTLSRGLVKTFINPTTKRQAVCSRNEAAGNGLSQLSRIRNVTFTKLTTVTPLSFSVTAQTDKHRRKRIEVCIDKFEEFQFQADVLNENSKGRLLVDDPDLKHQPELWCALLSFRQRLHGASGVKDIQNAIISRDVNLPTDGEYADKLWQPFLTLGLTSRNEDEILKETWAYIMALYKRTSRRYEPIYTRVIGHCLGISKSASLFWHDRLRAIDLPASNSLRRLVLDTLQKASTNLKNLQVIYHESGQRGMYDTIIPALCRRNMYREAVDWHWFLLNMNDGPLDLQSAKLLKPLLLKKHGFMDTNLHSARPRARELIESHETDERLSPDREVLMTRLRMNELLGEVHGVTPKTLSDQFLARLFATKAFSIDTIIPLLATFGVSVIGPLSLRELAIRCESPHDIVSKLSQLDEANISIGTSSYSKLIEKIALQNHAELLKSILCSDLHPDVYEDRKTQRSLLHQYIATEDWMQAWRTLEVLTAFENERGIEKAWNIVLGVFIQRKDHENISKIVENMLERKLPVYIHNLRQCFFRLIPAPVAGKRPSTCGDPVIKNLNFISNLWLSILRSDGVIPAALWDRVHCFYGMFGLLDELENLSRWLVFYYSTHPAHHRASKNIKSSGAFHVLADDQLHPLMQVFSPTRQAAIIAWGFKSLGQDQRRKRDVGIIELQYSPSQHKGFKCEQWARGIALLAELRDRGVAISPQLVPRECRDRLRMLFNERQSNRIVNRQAKKRNTQSLYEMVDHINQVWGANVFGFSQELLEPTRTDDAKRLIWQYIVEEFAFSEMPESAFSAEAHEERKKRASWLEVQHQNMDHGQESAHARGERDNGEAEPQW